MPRVTFQAKAGKIKGTLVYEYHDVVKKALEGLTEGQPISITFDTDKPLMGRQRAFYWDVVVPMYITGYKDQSGKMLKNTQAHKLLKDAFFELTGERASMADDSYMSREEKDVFINFAIAEIEDKFNIKLTDKE